MGNRILARWGVRNGNDPVRAFAGGVRVVRARRHRRAMAGESGGARACALGAYVIGGRRLTVAGGNKRGKKAKTPATIDEANRTAARIIAADPRYGGLMREWAQKILNADAVGKISRLG